MAHIKDILPSFTILFTTVGEAMALLGAVDIEAGCPTGIQSIAALGTKLQSLGPQYAIAKREIPRRS